MLMLQEDMRVSSAGKGSRNALQLVPVGHQETHLSAFCCVVVSRPAIVLYRLSRWRCRNKGPRMGCVKTSGVSGCPRFDMSKRCTVRRICVVTVRVASASVRVEKLIAIGLCAVVKCSRVHSTSLGQGCIAAHCEICRHIAMESLCVVSACHEPSIHRRPMFLDVLGALRAFPKNRQLPHLAVVSFWAA